MPPRKPSPVGAHVPTSRGLVAGALAYAEEVGAEAVQVFLSNPRGWAPSDGRPAEDAEFAERAARRRLVVYAHAPYLVNLASPTAETLRRSAESLCRTVRRGRRVGARGVVVHTGSAVKPALRGTALAQMRTTLLPLLDGLADDDPDLLLEPTAGGGAPLCSRIEDLEEYLAVLDGHPRVGVCLDTCHAFAAGHDLAGPGGVRRALNTLVRVTGKGRLRLVHANDSKDTLGSFRDRHANIGHGSLGEDPFVELFRHPVTRGVPVLVETPGGQQKHAEDIATLKRLRNA